MSAFKSIIVAAGITLAGTAICPTASSASSLLVDDGSYTFDKGTGLDWLDVIATQGIGYDDLSNNVGVHYFADGYRIATAADVLMLLRDSGAGPILENSPGHYAVNYNGTGTPLDALQAMLGVTEHDVNEVANQYNTIAYFEPDPLAQFELGTIQISTRPTTEWFGGPFALAFVDILGSLDASENSPYAGALLVRNDSVDVAVTPLPGSVYLFMSGLGLIGFVAWRNRRGGFSRSIAA